MSEASADGGAPAPVTVLEISYDGGPYCGFARQEGLPTVQGELERALHTVLRREVVTVGAGRTDTGVHALGQVVSFEATATDAPPEALLRSLNALAGPHIAIRGVRTAAPGFSARHSATAREYRYRLVPGNTPPLFLAPVSWWCKHDLDLDAMRAAGSALLGEHDFRSFCVKESAEGKSTVRDISTLEIVEGAEMGEDVVTVRVAGRSFLHSMVRVIVGSLVEVGRGRQPAAWLREALEACDRAEAGPTAPAQGLTLWSVAYPDDVWR